MTKALIPRDGVTPARSLPKKAAEAASLLATGMTYKQIAEALDTNASMIAKWAQREDFKKLYQQILERAGMRQYAKAINVLETQMDSKNEWLAQNAARDIANRFEKAVAGIESNRITVTLAGLPELGTPDNEETIDAQ